MTKTMFCRLFATSFALASATVFTFAQDGPTQFVDPPSTWTRAQAASEAAALATPSVRQQGEASEFIDAPPAKDPLVSTHRSDAMEVGPRVIHLGEATEFLDPAGTRSRADVLAEAVRPALQTSR